MSPEVEAIIEAAMDQPHPSPALAAALDAYLEALERKQPQPCHFVVVLSEN